MFTRSWSTWCQGLTPNGCPTRSNRSAGPAMCVLVMELPLQLSWRRCRAGKETRDQVGAFVRALQQEQMAAAVDDMESGVGYAVGQDPPVQHRDDRIVIAGQDEGGLAEPAQPGHP